MANFIRNLFDQHKANQRDKRYQSMLDNEQSRFAEVESVHDLPGIFHYWSNTYLAPQLRSFGYATPNEFFEKQIEAHCAKDPARAIEVFSPGSGNCDLEAGIASNLIGRGVTNFRIDCLDVNKAMLERGRKHAESLGVAAHIGLVEGDFNRWRAEPGRYDVVMANQSLHHVVELEHLFDAIREALADDGAFLVSDMIGRNGHMRWPEALEAMQPFWAELPPSYRYNQLMQRGEPEFVNHDCSVHDFEGIRSQDVLPLLYERFGFEFFFAYGNIIFPFIDRAFGHNFDANADFDRYFIDRVHARDERGLREGEWTPTSLIAVAVKGRPKPVLRKSWMTPERSIRRP
jgi:SAM-dependent methyltransferase